MNVTNRHARRDFEMIETFDVGVALLGSEVKSIRAGGGRFDGSYIKLLDAGAALIGATIPAYRFASQEYEPTRTRQLLLHKKELIRLRTKLHEQPRLTIVPLKWYTNGRLIKLKIALAKGKRVWEKKSVEKEKTETRQIEKELKENLKT